MTLLRLHHFLVHVITFVFITLDEHVLTSFGYSKTTDLMLLFMIFCLDIAVFAMP